MMGQDSALITLFPRLLSRGKVMLLDKKLVVVGAGAIGSSVAGWIAPHYERLWLLARGESAAAIKNKGLKFYLKGEEANAVPISIKIIKSLSEISPPYIIFVTVKNYDLDTTARMLRDQLGSHQPIIVALENGVENQLVLPRYFTKVIYGVVCFNAWRDGPGRVGHQKRGYIILGTPLNDLQPEQREVAAILRLRLDCSLTDRLEDAVHCKLAVNLTNVLMTLVGFQKVPVRSFDEVAQMSARLIGEGIQVLQAAGFKEHELGRIPSWSTIRLSVRLPASVTKVFYRYAVREELGMNSTSQDIFAGKATTELESLNGYMLKLAQKVGVPMPINQTVYEIAKERFGPDFQPMTEKELLTAIQNRLKR
jgi:2-dehydropantoate 2-reductase